MTSVRRWSIPAALLLAACADVDPPQPTPILPRDYAERFVEVLSCRSSVEHGLVYVRVRTAPEHEAIYRGAGAFPQGALVVKEEFGDGNCRRLNGYTVMRKEAPGHDPAARDWRFVRLNGRQEDAKDPQLARCAACHRACAADRDFTCGER